MAIVLTPAQAPNAYAVAERWVRTVREECLVHLLMFGERHLRRTLKEYSAYSNQARPPQGLQQQPPIPFVPGVPEGQIHCRDVLDGLIHDDYREVA